MLIKIFSKFIVRRLPYVLTYKPIFFSKVHSPVHMSLPVCELSLENEIPIVSSVGIRSLDLAVKRLIQNATDYRYLQDRSGKMLAFDICITIITKYCQLYQEVLHKLGCT